MKPYAHLDGNTFLIGNDRIERTYLWNGGNLIALTLTDRSRNRTWRLSEREPASSFPEQHNPQAACTQWALDIRVIPDDEIRPAHLQADVTVLLGALEIRRRFRVFGGVAAVACQWFLRGRAQGCWAAEHAAAGDQANIEDARKLQTQPTEPVIMERLLLERPHLDVTVVQFFDITDRRNNLLAERRIVPYLHPETLRGNLALVRDTLSNDRLFVLKEAPCSDVQLADAGYDFLIRQGELSVAGVGLTATDVIPDRWTNGYGCVVGAGGTDDLELFGNLRDYQHTLRQLKSGRDHMVMLNTWGDRGQDARINHHFALREIERAARLGISHFQLDDGWQAGQSSNSATPGGSLENIWQRSDYWMPHADRFPEGLGPIVAAAKAANIELCLWFNPSKDNSYANWRRDAHTLIQLFREHGIRTFKIDGVHISDKRAETNLRAMLDMVVDATDRQAVFNLDVTAMRRFGYHSFTEYGNIFLENRYTDWGNYYPHWTLRNLWQLSRYVPPQRLQIEFLNPARNNDRYAANDPLAPSQVPLDYCFAMTMMAQPLAWMEVGNLTEHQINLLSPIIKTYRKHQQDIHAGTILPIGDEPTGRSWTGFHSCCPGKRGYLLLLREWEPHARERHPFRVPGIDVQDVTWSRIMGDIEVDTRDSDSGQIIAKSNRSFSYGLFAYHSH